MAENSEMPKQPDPAEVERTRLAELLFTRAIHMTNEYRALIRPTGGLLTTSMVYAYNKGIQDSIKLLLKENTNVKKEVPNSSGS
jgi:hypothetical protein